MDSDDIEYEDEYVDAQAELPPVLDPQVEKEIQLVLAGSTIVKSSFNAVRTVLEKERHGTNGTDLVREMMSRRFIEVRNFRMGYIPSVNPDTHTHASSPHTHTRPPPHTHTPLEPTLLFIYIITM